MEDETKKITIEALILTEGKYVGPTVGVSMLPMLKTGRDSVVIRKKEGRLKPLDVALYKRGEKYVLHRVISVIEGGYIIRGDNCYSDERIAEDAVFGVLTEFFRGEKRVFVLFEFAEFFYSVHEFVVRKFGFSRDFRQNSERGFFVATLETVAEEFFKDVGIFAFGNEKIPFGTGDSHVEEVKIIAENRIFVRGFSVQRHIAEITPFIGVVAEYVGENYRVAFESLCFGDGEYFYFVEFFP